MYRVFEALDELGAIVEEARGLPMTAGCVVPRGDVLELIDDIKEHARRTRAQEVLVTMITGNGSQMRRFATLCRNAQIPFKVLPALGELINGRVSIKNIREIRYKDLLGREEIHINMKEVDRQFRGKTVLVTGAAGSIGSELCRQLATLGVKD